MKSAELQLPITSLFTEGQWEGQRAFVVGGGESARRFPWRRLLGERVLACNSAHRCGVATAVVTGDRRWLNVKGRFEQIKVPVVYARRLGAKPWKDRSWRPPFPVHVIDCCKGDELWGTTFAEGLSPGGTGIRAVNLAAILGADPIYLIGFDMQGMWWHRQICTSKPVHDDLLAHWQKTMASGVVGTRIYNLSPSSRLCVVPFRDWRQVFEREES